MADGPQHLRLGQRSAEQFHSHGQAVFSEAGQNGEGRQSGLGSDDGVNGKGEGPVLAGGEFVPPSAPGSVPWDAGAVAQEHWPGWEADATGRSPGPGVLPPVRDVFVLAAGGLETVAGTRGSKRAVLAAEE
jgi:hypothetical protein